MSTASIAPQALAEVEYPDSDGQPMADNQLQYEWIVTITGGLQGLFADDPEVFVAGDLLWYPVQGDPKTRVAPDAMVAFGVPKKGYRGSYKQWVEGGVAPQVVFEVLSPGNTPAEMRKKWEFYDRFLVEEYYLFDPDSVALSAWIRGATGLEPVAQTDGWVSPRLGVRFDLLDDDLRLIGPDGRAFLTFEDTIRSARQLEELAEEQQRRAEEQQRRAERMAEKLRALGIDPDEA